MDANPPSDGGPPTGGPGWDFRDNGIDAAHCGCPPAALVTGSGISSIAQTGPRDEKAGAKGRISRADGGCRPQARQRRRSGQTKTPEKTSILPGRLDTAYVRGIFRQQAAHENDASTVDMINNQNESVAKSGGDLVLQEMWRIKDELSAARGHDIHRLFAEARERQKRCGHPVVNFEKGKTAKTTPE